MSERIRTANGGELLALMPIQQYKDSGPSLTSEETNRVFERFYRADLRDREQVAVPV